jgi:hypothetical protein
MTITHLELLELIPESIGFTSDLSKLENNKKC